MRPLTDNEKAFIEGIAALALEHGIDVLDAQFVFGMMARAAAVTGSRMNPSLNVKAEVERFVQGYAQGIGITAVLSSTLQTSHAKH